MPAVLLTQATDAYVDQSSADKTTSWLEGNLRISNQGAGAKRPVIFFNRPFVPGVTVFSAKLRLYQQEAWAGSVTLTVQRISAEWSTSKATFNGQPPVTGVTAALTQSGTLAEGLWEIDVTALMQEVANGAPWYGFRIITNRTTDGNLFRASSSRSDLRPQLLVDYGLAPDQPTDLKPGGGRATSLAKPTLTFTYKDPVGNDPVSSVQVQMSKTVDGSGNPNGTVFDSGAIASSSPQLDMTTWGGAPSIVAGEVWYWRTRVTDGSGLTSIWSVTTSFTRVAKGSLTITAPPVAGIKSGTPTVSWTFTGQTQRAYEILMVNNATRQPMYVSGKITSAATSVGIPLGAITADNLTLRVHVRIYDTIAREATPGDAAYQEAVWIGPIVYDPITPANSLGGVSDSILPVFHLTWQRASAPDRWQIQRSEDAGASWYYIADAPGAAYSTGGTGYKFDDATAGSYKQYQWRVLAVVGGIQASGSPIVAGVVKRVAPILMYTDMSQPIQFLNPARDRANLDVQELHLPLAGPPVLVTQRLGLKGGHMSGVLADENTIGQTAKSLYARFKGMRANSGVPLLLYEGDESYVVVAYNMQDDMIIDTQGIYYFVEFDWVQIA